MFFKINKIPEARCRDQPERVAFPFASPRPTLFYEHWLAVCVLLIFLPASLHAQTVLTVKEAEYRSRWAGKQEDRLVTPQYFAPGGGLDEETEGQIAAEEQAGPTFVENIDRMAENVKRGLRFGPLDFQLGLNTGWNTRRKIPSAPRMTLPTTTAFLPRQRSASPTSGRLVFGM
jgi:hypothetical protein